MTPKTAFAMIASLLAVAAVSALAPGAFAQARKGDDRNLPSAFEGFSRDSKNPVQIEANAFEVHDKDRYAIFLGNVVVKQGDSTLRARELKVYYEGSLRGGDKGAKA